MIGAPLHKKYFAMAALNLVHLQTFSHVIALGSFSAAAAHLGLTQPAISLQIRQLEARLQVRLIERVGRRLTPTAAGNTLLEHARRIDALVEEALQDLASHADGVAGRVAIGTGATACIHLLPPMLQRLRQHFPALDVRVATGHTEAMLRDVEHNRLDLALVTLPASGRSLVVTPLLEDPFVAIFAEGATLPPKLSAEHLADLPMVAFESGSGTRLVIDDWFAQAGLRLRPVMELGSIEAIKEMVGAGLGFSIVPAMAVQAVHHRRGLQIQPVTPMLKRTLGLVLRQDKPLSRSLQTVLEAMRALAP
ncbi:DNA-binding transcriptional LysR family regulator [Pseudomonas sp. TE3610]